MLSSKSIDNSLLNAFSNVLLFTAEKLLKIVMENQKSDGNGYIYLKNEFNDLIQIRHINSVLDYFANALIVYDRKIDKSFD